MPRGLIPRRACVIGWPVAHSRSPLIHNYWLERYNIAGEYLARPVEPGAVPDFLGNLEAHGFIGCNVTVPHKEAAYRAVSIADAETRLLGSVNTVFIDNGKPWGLSTDGPGFLAGMAAAIPDFPLKGAAVEVLGAGGSARAIIAALLKAGAGPVTVANRTAGKAAELERVFSGKVRAIAWAGAGAAMGALDLLVNTTPLGMKGRPPLLLPLDLLPVSAVVADIVYIPLKTGLLEAAERRGNRTVGGLGMLLNQAVPGFEKWFGIRPEVTTALSELVARNILEDAEQP